MPFFKQIPWLRVITANANFHTLNPTNWLVTTATCALGSIGRKTSGPIARPYLMTSSPPFLLNWWLRDAALSASFISWTVQLDRPRPEPVSLGPKLTYYLSCQCLNVNKAAAFFKAVQAIQKLRAWAKNLCYLIKARTCDELPDQPRSPQSLG